MRSLDDVKRWFSQDYTGTCETAVARWHRLIPSHVKVVVIRRDPAEVVESLMSVGKFNRPKLEKTIGQLDRALDRVSGLIISYRGLAHEEVCEDIFEYCLPYNHNHNWWTQMDATNLQCSMPHIIRYYNAHYDVLDRLAREATRALRRPKRPILGEPDADGVTIQEEALHPFMEDAAPLFAEHCRAVGEPEDEWKRKNLPLIEKMAGLGLWQIMTARCNGRVFGYLTTIVGPSLEHENFLVGTQTLFYASSDAPGRGLGLKLQRAAIEGLKRRGVKQVVMRAGVRGSGDRLDVLYRRLHAKPFGELYTLSI